MNHEQAFLTSIAAFFSGRGYYAVINQPIYETNDIIDVAAALPILSELQFRINKGFAPCGILRYVTGSDWVDVDDIVKETGYKLAFVGKVLEDAQENGWVELDVADKPRVRNINYRVPARETIAAFNGVTYLQRKLDLLKENQGIFHQAYFVFPVPVDSATIDIVASNGYGILRFYEKQGAFLEIVPADTMEIDNMHRHCVLTENVLYENMWLRRDEII